MLNRYTPLGFIKLILSFLLTKIFYKNSRLIRFPFDIRNKSSIDLGKGLTTGVGCRIEAFPLNKEIVLQFGSNIILFDQITIFIIFNNISWARWAIKAYTWQTKRNCF